MLRFLFLIAGAALLPACNTTFTRNNFSKDHAEGKACCTQFYAKLKAQDFRAVYHMTQEVDSAQFFHVLDTIDVALGRLKSYTFDEVNTQVQRINGHTTGDYALSCSAEYERGSTRENFVLHRDELQLSVTGYHVRFR